MADPDIVLITCVKTKRRKPCAAKDLYISPLFVKQRAYAEESGVPWFILSAEHGLVLPDEWLSPYERYLPDTPSTFRSAWGLWVVARLQLLAGPLFGGVVEAHAGSAYIDALRPHLEADGATLTAPLQGLSMGARLAWYGSKVGSAEQDPECDDSRIVARLLHESAAVSPDEFLAMGKQVADRPGLYSWWVDEAGAASLGRGLGLAVEPGLIYAGLAGATRWPSGQRSKNTLWLRITTMGHAGPPFDLQRFIDAQETVYERVRAELRAGRKTTHWIWFIFPQVKGLGHSAAADLYGVADLDEARAFLAHPVLGLRLRECVRLLMAVPAPRPIGLIVGREDARKVRSSMTLFAAATEDNAEFLAVLDRYFDGDHDDRTLELIR